MTLIEALRCSAGPMSDCKPDCPYRMREKIDPKFLFTADETDENGVGYLLRCDVDRLVLDAAAELERLTKNAIPEHCRRCTYAPRPKTGYPCKGCKYNGGRVDMFLEEASDEGGS